QSGDSSWLPAASISRSFRVKAFNKKPDYNKLLSPNGDGINDKLVIQNIVAYPKNEIRIYDENGKVVFHKRGYENRWKGRVSNGEVVKESTYYFVLKSKNKIKVKGTITVIRK